MREKYWWMQAVSWSFTGEVKTILIYSRDSKNILNQTCEDVHLFVPCFGGKKNALLCDLLEKKQTVASCFSKTAGISSKVTQKMPYPIIM